MACARGNDSSRLIEAALAPGVFVDRIDAFDFVDGLEAVRSRIASRIGKDAGEAERAAAALELFIAGCYEKAEEIDDSSGGFGQLVEGLFCDWIRARQTAGADPDETARVLLSWMDGDDYGFCLGLEKQAVPVLDRKGLAAFERAVEAGLRAEGCGRGVRARNVGILKRIHQQRRDVKAYAALCEEDGRLAPADCEALARMCLARRRPADALAWAERGLELGEDWRGSGGAWGLPHLRREILTRLGRGEEALASAWADYRRSPSTFSYRDLMKFVVKGERAEWHAQAMAALEAADLSSRIELFVETKERERLAATIAAASRAELVAQSHYRTEPAAKRLVKSHPPLAAKLHVAMALRIVEAGKSRYYDAALANLARARKLLLAQGRSGEREWKALAAEIRAAHARKSSFLPGFDRLDAGRSAREPSFATRARRRWRRRAGVPVPRR